MLALSNIDYRSEDVWGSARVRLVEVTFDSSYDAGGESLTPASVSLAEIIGVSVIACPVGYDVSYDHTTGKLQVATGDVEALAAADLDAVTARILVIGR